MNVNKDWTGNRNSIYTTLGASNHSDKERQSHDYYATEPKATELLLAEESFAPVIWECACGEGHMAKVLEEHGYQVISTDLIYRGYGKEEPVDFLHEPVADFDGDIITIVAEADGEGATKWGKLKSGAGWISLDYGKKI